MGRLYTKAAHLWEAALRRFASFGRRRTTSTKNLREPHEISTGRDSFLQYPVLVMKGAFVVQLWNVGRGMAGQMEGLVEEVDTGRQFRFRSEPELIEFLRKHSSAPGGGLPGKDDTR